MTETMAAEVIFRVSTPPPPPDITPTQLSDLEVGQSHSEADSSSEASSSDHGRSIFLRDKSILMTTERDSHKSQKLEQILTAEEWFTRRNGIIYVADEFWRKGWDFSSNAHIYVSSTSVKKPLLSALGQPKTQTDNTDHHHSEAATTTRFGTETDKLLDNQTVTTSPRRIKIVNQALIEDMSRVCMASDTLNHDHVAPFRSIIPSEQAFRKRHQELETEFSKTAQEHPDDPAVLRQDTYLPWALSYLVDQWCALPITHFADVDLRTLVPGNATLSDLLPLIPATQPVNDIDTSRVLLDGYRALIHLLDTDLKSLVESHRRIQSKSADKLPFSHLWYLFSPGEEILVRSPRYQAYRVLTVTGGRRSLEAREGSTIKSISDLVIKCFYIDYDGAEFGAVASQVVIKPYDGMRSIIDLPAYPLLYHQTKRNGEDVPNYLHRRGQKFEGLTKVSHRRYKGFTLRLESLFDTVDEVS